MAHDQNAWLAQNVEEVIEPELPICDPHHHLWDFAERPYLLAELHRDTGAGHRVVRTVFVECTWGYRTSGPAELRPVGETAAVRAVAEASTVSGNAEIAGIVGFADLTLGDAVAPVLEAHIEAGGGRFRGVRHAAGWDASDAVRNSHTNPPNGLLLDPSFRRGFAWLERYDLVFDAWLYHPQLPELVDLARAFPATTIVLDHMGGPLGISPYAGRRAEVLASWRSGIDALATCPNVVVKLGGLQMPICGFDWHKRQTPPGSAELAEAGGPYYRTCLDRFGPERAMFESNFPVDRVSCSYTVLWNTFKRLARHCSPRERALLFHDTAARVYRLSPVA